jgi:hypothetical protein
VLPCFQIRQEKTQNNIFATWKTEKLAANSVQPAATTGGHKVDNHLILNNLINLK